MPYEPYPSQGRYSKGLQITINAILIGIKCTDPSHAKIRSLVQKTQQVANPYGMHIHTTSYNTHACACIDVCLYMYIHTHTYMNTCTHASIHANCKNKTETLNPKP